MAFPWGLKLVRREVFIGAFHLMCYLLPMFSY
jgi:hypothetical protein